jgi:DNA-binding NarL/FixJ family response regulator
MSSPARLLLVDDHAIVRQGLSALLSSSGRFAVSGEAGDVEEARAKILAGGYDAIVLDLSLKDASGLTLLREVRAAGASAPCIVLSMHDAALYAAKARAAGAQGYVMKDRADEELFEALDTVLSGGTRFPPEADAPGEAAGGADYGLSPREEEIFLAVGDGLSTKAIAERMGLSARTVDVHRANIKRKVRAETAADFLAKAMAFRRRQDGPSAAETEEIRS